MSAPYWFDLLDAYNKAEKDKALAEIAERKE